MAFSVNFSLTEQDLRWKSSALFPSRSFQFSPTTTNPIDYLTAERLHSLNKTKHVQSRLERLSKILQILNTILLSHIKVGKLNLNQTQEKFDGKEICNFSFVTYFARLLEKMLSDTSPVNSVNSNVKT